MFPSRRNIDFQYHCGKKYACVKRLFTFAMCTFPQVRSTFMKQDVSNNTFFFWSIHCVIYLVFRMLTL